MHTNHRRKNKYKNCQSVISGNWKPYFRRDKHKVCRQQAKRKIFHEEWDDIPNKYYKTLRWDYF